DLEKLFLPAWAQEPSSAKQYAQYEGQEDQRPDRRSDRRPRPPQRRGGPPGGPRRDQGEQGRPRGDQRRGPGGKPAGRERAAGGDRRGPDRGPGHDRREPFERREPPQPLPQLNVSLLPDDKGVESLARQIKMTGRAYPLFGIAQMILQKP